MRNRVKVAPTSMPPTAIGRTMEYQIANAAAAQPSSPAPPGMETGELRSHKKDQEGNKQAPGEHAAGEVQCAETRSDDVADAEVCGADCRRRKRRHAAGRHGWRTRGFGQFEEELLPKLPTLSRKSRLAVEDV